MLKIKEHLQNFIEIQNQINESLDKIAKRDYYAEDLLYYENCKVLLDYITNLQQEINKLTAESTEWESKYYDLQQENEFLKLNNPEQNMEHFRIIKENKRKIDNLRKENKKLKECYCSRTDCGGRIKDNKKYNSIYQEKECYKLKCETAIRRISLLKMDDITIETNKALDFILNSLIGSDEE